MSTTAKISAWIAAVAAIVGMIIALLTFSGDRSQASTEVAVVHESRHVKTESDVEHIEETVEDHYRVIQAQYQASNQMLVIVLENQMKD